MSTSAHCICMNEENMANKHKVQMINSENRGGRESLKVMELEKGEDLELIKKRIPGDHRGSRAADRGKQTR